MNSNIIAMAAIFLAGCSTPQAGHRDALMDEIERQVQLPAGARPIREYARYYSDDGKGEITAIYLLPDDYELKPGDTCENSSGREVPCPSMRPGWAMSVGDRRWVEPRELPFMSDGGCMQVTVIFDKAKSVVKRVECNVTL